MTLEINEKINSLMIYESFSRNELSEHSGVTKSSLGRYLNGECDIYANNLVNLLKVLEIDINEILIHRLQKHVNENFNPKNLSEDIESTLNKLKPTVRETILKRIIKEGSKIKSKKTQETVGRIEACLKLNEGKEILC